MTAGFIAIGPTRIKKANIKQFGIGTEEIAPQEMAPSYRGSGFGGLSDDLALVGALATAAVTVGAAKLGLQKGDSRKMTRQYLYVLTYQNENQKFYEDQVDIHDALKRLEAM